MKVGDLVRVSDKAVFDLGKIGIILGFHKDIPNIAIIRWCGLPEGEAVGAGPRYVYVRKLSVISPSIVSKDNGINNESR